MRKWIIIVDKLLLLKFSSDKENKIMNGLYIMVNFQFFSAFHSFRKLQGYFTLIHSEFVCMICSFALSLGPHEDQIRTHSLFLQISQNITALRKTFIKFLIIKFNKHIRPECCQFLYYVANKISYPAAENHETA